MTRHLLLPICALALPVTVAAQIHRFEALPRTQLPVTAGLANGVVAGDIDGDGDVDLVVGGTGFGARTAVLCNDGRGRFDDTSAASMPASDIGGHATLVDVDGDGDLDLVLGFFAPGVFNGARERLYLNDGSGVFTDVTGTHMPTNLGFTSVAAGDADGDGDVDLVVAASPQRNRLYLNDGSGVFTDVTAARTPTRTDPTQAVAWIDFDGDGDLDIYSANGIVGGPGAQDTLYENDGAGFFTDVTAAALPQVATVSLSIAVGDLDGDGDPDLLCGDDGDDRLYRNDGGTFTDVSLASLPAQGGNTVDLALGDVDEDGDLDVLLGNGGFLAEQNRLYANDGSGAFTDETADFLPLAQRQTDGVALADVDGDGDLDALSAGFGSGWVYFSEPQLLLNLKRQLHAPIAPRIGQTYTLLNYARTAPMFAGQTAFTFLSTFPAAVPLVVPSVGVIGIDPASAVPLGAVWVTGGYGMAPVVLGIPNQPALVGLPLYAQSVLVGNGFVLRTSNVSLDIVQ